MDRGGLERGEGITSTCTYTMNTIGTRTPRGPRRRATQPPHRHGHSSTHPHYHPDITTATHTHNGTEGDEEKSPTARVAAGLDIHSVGTATEGSTLVRDLNPRPPEPHANHCGVELRHQVAITRCSGHRCRNTGTEDQPSVVRHSQHYSQHGALATRRAGQRPRPAALLSFSDAERH